MSPQPRPPRAVLVEGSCADSAAQVLRRCRPDLEVVRVPGFLAAMGELSQCAADVVIGPAPAMVGMAAATARCLRRLAPQAMLIVVADSPADSEARAAVAHGFDRLLLGPLDGDVLAALLARADRAAPAERRPPDGPAIDRSFSDMPAMPRPTEDAAAAPGTPAAPQNTEQSTEQRPAASPAPAPDDAALGDVDLVEAVLHSRDDLLPIAMRIIAAQSGVERVGLAARVPEVPADEVHAPVSYAGHCFGYLHAPPPVSEALLAAWADWLSRWLAMDNQVGQLEVMSHKDELTGAWNRRYFNRFLEQLLDKAGRDRAQVTLLVFDIDDFKLYNDRFGHAAGDEILREAARLMTSFVRDHDVVARIGGDEFAVIFWDAGGKRQPDSQHPDTVRQAARRFEQAICAHHFPKLGDQAPGTLTISGGLASFPWDGRTPAELLDRADRMAIQSKRQGKNAITFGPGALRQCGEPPADA